MERLLHLVKRASCEQELRKFTPLLGSHLAHQVKKSVHSQVSVSSRNRVCLRGGVFIKVGLDLLSQLQPQVITPIPWWIYLIVFILIIYCCKDIVKKSDTVLSLSSDAKFVIKKLKLYSRTRRFKPGGDQQRFAPIHIDEEWMEPLSLIGFQSPK